MPRGSESGPDERDGLLHDTQQRVNRVASGFIDFAFQGNVLQVAFGLILASIFTDLVKHFVSDILMPPISILLPLHKNIEEKFAVLRPGPHYNASVGYNTLRLAQEDGAVVMPYGSFIYQIVSFFMVGISLYGMAQLYTLISHDPIVKHMVKCKYCRQRINEKSKRCIKCTSWLDGREDRLH